MLGDGVHGLSHYVCWEMGFMVCPIMCVGRWGSWSVPLCVLGDGVHGLSHYVCWEMGFMVCPIMCVGRWGSWSVPLCVLGDGVHGLTHYVCWEMGFMVCAIMCAGDWRAEGAVEGRDVLPGGPGQTGHHCWCFSGRNSGWTGDRGCCSCSGDWWQEKEQET